MPHHLAVSAKDAPPLLEAAPEDALWLQCIRRSARDFEALATTLYGLHRGQLPVPPKADAGAGYGRRLLHHDSGLEVMQAGWHLGGYAVPHDHGPATGAVLVLSGYFVETVWQLRAGQLAAIAAHEHSKGSVMRVTAGLVHSLHALSEGHTLHVYAPPVTGMRVYDLAAREVLELADEHGAWLPRDPHVVRARRSFEEACDGES